MFAVRSRWAWWGVAATSVRSPGTNWIASLSSQGKHECLENIFTEPSFCLKMMYRALEYSSALEKLNLSAIRTVRVLRPLKAINRIPSMRILV